MLVEERMTRKVVTSEAQSSIVEARETMRKHGIRHLLIVEGERLVGIVSDRDLIAAAEEGTTLASVMTRAPLVASPETAVDECAQLMRTHRISALPVIDEGRLVGILTSSDILDAFVELTGVAGATSLLMIHSADMTHAEARVQQIVTQRRGQIKWLHCESDRDPARLQVRLAGRKVDDIVTALEAAGFEVTNLVAGSGTRRAAE